MWRPFEPLFVVRSKSEYREEWSFTTVNQYRALYMLGDDYEKHAYEVEESERCGLLPANPLHLDNVFIAGIQMIGN